MRRRAGRIEHRALFLAFMLLSAAGWSAQSAAVALAPLLDAGGTTVTLDGSATYTIAEYALSTNKTLACNGATIQSSGGPIRASAAGVVLIVDNCVIQGSGWALLGALNGATLIVRNNTRLTGNGANSGIYVGSATLDMSGGSIDQMQWGVNMVNADAALHGLSITNTIFGVQNVAGKVTIDGASNLQNTNASNPGVGVSIIASPSYPSRGASAVIRDATFTGFGNAVDIQPTHSQGLIAGTAEITGSTFNTPFYSALAAVDATNFRVANSKVLNAATDGIYIVNSTGVIDGSQILNSLNSGVTFWGCPDGPTIRNSLVSGSAHQGIAVVSDTANHRTSHNIHILGNTLRGNVLANVLIDEQSDALLQGNIETGAPDFSLRLHGGASAGIVAELLLASHAGIEVKDASILGASLSMITGHDNNGVLAYAGASANFSHCSFQANGSASGSFSVFVNSGAQVIVNRCGFDAATQLALYNNAANATAATSNYWGDPSGPRLQAGGGGNGGILGWNAPNGSQATWAPWLNSAALQSRLNTSFGVTAGATTSWQPDINLSLSITGRTGFAPLTSAVIGALRVADSSTVTAPPPPASSYADGVLAVWAEYEVLSRAQSGTLRVKAAGANSSTRLSRLASDGCWLPVATAWDTSAGEVLFTPARATALNGVFAIGAIPAGETALARQLIAGYYTDILGRPAEAGAVDGWYQGYFAQSVSLGMDARFAPREMARVFFSSNEYAARLRTDDQFLRDAYQVFLGRSPSTAELNGWFAGTWNRPQVVALFAESDEFGAHIQGLFPCLAGAPTRNFVTTMYIGLLDRLVDAGGLAYFEGLLDSAFATGGIEQVRAQARGMGSSVITSSEYLNKAPSNETHVVRLYRAYLGRFPSSDEINYWRGLLDSNTRTTADLIALFAAAPEFTSRLDAYFNR